MDQREFSQIRHQLGKTQRQLAQLLGTSLKAIQSYEQGWRNIPLHTERQVLFLLALKHSQSKKAKPCWDTNHCPEATREHCAAWEFKAGHLCWFINGTICRGDVQESWQQKMTICHSCTVYLSMFQPL